MKTTIITCITLIFLISQPNQKSDFIYQQAYEFKRRLIDSENHY